MIYRFMKDKLKYKRACGRNLLLNIILLAVLVAVFTGSVMIGRFRISPGELLDILTGSISDDSTSASLVLYEVRIARIAAAAVIGAGLSAAGAAYQGIFRNPMVSPDILGAATGASFGAALAILLGLGTFATQLFAFVSGLAAVATAYFTCSFLNGRSGSATTTLVLTGMVVSAVFSAFISIIKFVGDPYDTLPAVTFWLMGGLTYVTKGDVWVMAVPFITGILVLMALRWKLNLLTFNDEEARSMGVDTTLVRSLVILAATLVSSSAVAVGGMIGWVGLIIPHIARMLAGPDYSKMLSVSALLGSIFLMVVDDAARCLFAQEIPLGVLTAIIGAPFFLYLMYQGRRSFL